MTDQTATMVGASTAREIFTLLVGKKVLVLQMTQFEADALVNNLRVIKTRENKAVEEAGFDPIDSVIKCKCLEINKLTKELPVTSIAAGGIIRDSIAVSWELSLSDPKPKRTYSIVSVADAPQ